MNASAIKERINKGSDKIERGVDDAAESLGNGAEALCAKADAMQDQLRDLGRRLLGNTKELTEQATSQMKLHPLAAFGIAFAAGVILARALRR